MSLVEKILFPVRKDDRGELVFFEALKEIPFEMKRIYFLKNLSFEKARGFHAHKNLKQVMFCISGSCRVALDNGKAKEEFHLRTHSEGIFLNSLLWREMYDFSPDCILLVIASDYYDEEDYIRDYNEFLRKVK